jgi:hypothetical protein
MHQQLIAEAGCGHAGQAHLALHPGKAHQPHPPERRVISRRPGRRALFDGDQFTRDGQTH